MELLDIYEQISRVKDMQLDWLTVMEEPTSTEDDVYQELEAIKKSLYAAAKKFRDSIREAEFSVAQAEQALYELRRDTRRGGSRSKLKEK